VEALRVMWWLLALGLSSALAGEQAGPPPGLAGHQCVLEIPKDSGWSWAEITPQMAAANLIALARSADEESAVLVLVAPSPGASVMGEKGIEAFKTGMAKSALKSSGTIRFLSTVPIVVHGVPGFAVAAEIEAEDKSKRHLATRVFVANDCHYTVQAIATTAALTAMQEQILSSFDFVGEPKVPAGPLLPFLTDGSKPIEYQIGQLVGAALVFAVIGWIILLAIRAGRRSRSA
jgi:hypothetical protein